VPKVAVTLPADAKGVKQTKDEIKFVVGKGKAKAAVESFRKQFRDAGWKEDVASMAAMAGTLSFSKDDQHVTITYSDTGFMPTEVSLSSMRAELEAAR
jgi:Zn/Cd-binding protein ZinT